MSRATIYVKSLAHSRCSTHFHFFSLHVGVFKLLLGDVMVLLSHLLTLYTHSHMQSRPPGLQLPCVTRLRGCRADTPVQGLFLSHTMEYVPQHGYPYGLPVDSGRAGHLSSTLCPDTRASLGVACLLCCQPREAVASHSHPKVAVQRLLGWGPCCLAGCQGPLTPAWSGLCSFSSPSGVQVDSPYPGFFRDLAAGMRVGTRVGVILTEPLPHPIPLKMLNEVHSVGCLGLLPEPHAFPSSQPSDFLSLPLATLD